MFAFSGKTVAQITKAPFDFLKPYYTKKAAGGASSFEF
jgi:hypothetical protein